MSKIIVKAANGLEFWCQGKKVSPEKEVSITMNHDIACKISDGSLIEVKKKSIKNS